MILLLSVDRNETFRAEIEAYDTMGVENMRRVTAKLDYVLVGLPIISAHHAITELVFEFVRLGLYLCKGLRAPLADVRLIVHKVLNTSNHDRVLYLTFADSAHE